MKKYFAKFLFALGVFFSMTFTVYAADTYTLDPMHSYVLWHINHFGFSNPSGKWFANGTVTLDKTQPQNSKVNVTIKVDELVTGIPELDKHLKEKLFFNVAEYPTATFISDKVTLVHDNEAKVHGLLTLHGVSKPVTLDVILNKSGVNPINDKATVGFTAKTTLKRSDFGISTLLPGVGDVVTIDIEAEAVKNN